MSPIKKDDFNGRLSVEEVDDELEEDQENEMEPKFINKQLEMEPKSRS